MTPDEIMTISTVNPPRRIRAIREIRGPNNRCVRVYPDDPGLNNFDRDGEIPSSTSAGLRRRNVPRCTEVVIDRQPPPTSTTSLCNRSPSYPCDRCKKFIPTTRAQIILTGMVNPPRRIREIREIRGQIQPSPKFTKEVYPVRAGTGKHYPLPATPIALY